MGCVCVWQTRTEWRPTSEFALSGSGVVMAELELNYIAQAYSKCVCTRRIFRIVLNICQSVCCVCWCVSSVSIATVVGLVWEGMVLLRLELVKPASEATKHFYRTVCFGFNAI